VTVPRARQQNSAWAWRGKFRVEPWRFAVSLRVYHGYGPPFFEFAFRIGGLSRARRERLESEWADAYADDCKVAS
jgi:hypothetical protein